MIIHALLYEERTTNSFQIINQLITPVGSAWVRYIQCCYTCGLWTCVVSGEVREKCIRVVIEK